MPFITVNDVRIYYEEHGQGDETIVFGHSMLFNLRMFDDQVDVLKSNYRCLLFDFKGQGKSEVAPGGYDLDSLTEETVELIKTLNCNPCHFVGFSMGGMVGMRLAIRDPELIKSLILIDTTSEPEPFPDSFKNKMMLWVARNVGLRPIANKIVSMFFGPKFLKDPKRKDLRIAWKHHFLANDRRGLVLAVKGVLYRKAITSDLNRINVPTLILWGDQDFLTDREKAEIMHKQIKSSELKIIPGAGHMSTVEEPVIVNEMIIDFLKPT
ncbi:MAG: alpha/beta hydrolase [Bacteroidota bacterium]